MCYCTHIPFNLSLNHVLPKQQHYQQNAGTNAQEYKRRNIQGSIWDTPLRRHAGLGKLCRKAGLKPAQLKLIPLRSRRYSVPATGTAAISGRCAANL